MKIAKIKNGISALALLALAGCGAQNGAQQNSANLAAQNGASSVSDAATKNQAAQPASASGETADPHAGHNHAAGEHKHAMPSAVPFAHHTALAFSSAPAAPRAAQSARWTLKISNRKTGKPIQKFETLHEKMLHLIVVSDDYAWFSHIHPQWKGNGVFVIDYAVPRAGNYTLYADYSTEDGGHEVAQHRLKIAGANPRGAQPQLVADELKTMWIVKTVASHQEGKDAVANAPRYQVALMPMPGVLRAGQDAMLHFQVRDAKGKPLSDLQRYMGAFGHAVILSQRADIYLHTHPMEGESGEMMMGEMDHSKMPSAAGKTSGGPDVMFHTNFPRAGLYRAWGQFMHRGKVISAGYNLRVLPALAEKASP